MPRVVVYHGYYGCDTGCCGHYIEIDDVEVGGSWAFDHPYGKEDHKEWAIQFAKEVLGNDFHYEDLDWENCLVVDD